MVKSTASAGNSLGSNEPSANARPLVVGSGSARSSIDATPINSTAQLAEKQSAEKARQRALLRDNQIRKTAGMAMSKQSGARPRPSNFGRSPQKTGPEISNSLANFELREAETILESNTIVEAARHMAAKRLDFVLVVDVMGRLVGIVTDKDLAFRVVAEGLDPRQTTVSQVMTRDPQCVQSSLGVFEALEVMSKNHFRHLPVKEDERVLGVLDIAKCLYDALQKLELADAAAHQIASALETVGKEFAGVMEKKTRNNDALNYADALRDALSSPKLSSILSCDDDCDAIGGDPQCLVVTLKCTVLQAVKQLKERKETALLVTDEQGAALVGIFTTKDVLLRVVAAGLDANTTSIIRVMTPHPDAATPDVSIVSALRQMHNGHYLHLPVLSARDKSIIGVVDVLQLTYAVLEQMNSLKGRDETPLWHQLWSPTADGATEVSSIQGSHRSEHHQVAYVPAPPSTADDFCLLPSSVIFKIKLAGNEAAILLPAVNILQLPSLQELEAEALMRFGATRGQLCFVDDESDVIAIRDDAELSKLVNLVMAAGKDKVNMLLQGHDVQAAKEKSERSQASLIETSEGLSLALIGGGLAVLGAGVAVAALYLLRSQRS